MSNEATKQQIKMTLDQMIEEANHPDERKEMLRLREKKAQRVAKRFGL